MKMKKLGALECVEITLVTGYPDRDERRYSNLTSYGPYIIIRAEESETFIAAIKKYLKKKRKAKKVIAIEVRAVGLWDTKLIATGQHAINYFCRYLDKKQNWL